MAYLKKALKWLVTGIEPSEEKKAGGFADGEAPAPGHFDYMFKSTYDAIEELQEKSAEKDTVAIELNKKANTIDMTTALAKKVNVFEGKGLSTNDYTQAEKEKLANLQNTDVSELVTKEELTTHKSDNILHNTYVTCVTASATVEKAVTAVDFNLVAGARITVNFTNANNALSPTLKINTNIAKPIIQNDGNSFGKILSGVYEFLYNGTSFIVLNNSGGGAELPDLVKNNGTALYDLSVNSQLTKLPSLLYDYKNIVIDEVLYSFNKGKLYTTNLKTYIQTTIDLPADLTMNNSVFRSISVDTFIYVLDAQDFRKYDITNNIWTKVTLPTNITNNTSNISSLSTNGEYIYFVGVFGVVRYNPTTNIFNSETTSYPSNIFTSPGYVAGSSYANGNIYALGYSTTTNLAIYNINSKTWSSSLVQEALDSPWDAKVVVLNNNLLALTLNSSVVIYNYINNVTVKICKTAHKSCNYAYLNDNTLINVLANGAFYLMQITEG